MKSKDLMKLASIIVLLVTMYIVVFWKPSVVDNTIIEENPVEEVNNTDENQGLVNADNVDIDLSNFDNSVDTNEQAALRNVYLGDFVFSEVLNKIPKEEKNQVNTIVKKISVSEWAKVNKLLNSEDRTKGTIEAFSILKKRLKSKDFEELERIMKGYIDLSTIGNSI